MDCNYPSVIDMLNHEKKEKRLDALRKLAEAILSGRIDAADQSGGNVNNHIHTTYSFSPYSPARAIWEAYRAGLTTAGIMDHDSICGAREFIEAGAIMGLATTIGVECRVHFTATKFCGKRINNPDQKSNAYIALHGIPHNKIDDVEAYFAPFIVARQRRNIRLVERINQVLEPFGITLDYARDVLPQSNHFDGGTVTERHILFGLAHQLVAGFGKGLSLVNFLERTMKIAVPSVVRQQLSDKENRLYHYDLLGVLKQSFVEAFYIEAFEECPMVEDILYFAEKCSCISAYAYLGDVDNSITGDKKAQKFEDDYLDDLVPYLKKMGFNAITYMPSRNSDTQMDRIMALCRENGLLQICGEDINSPRQPFVCKALRKKNLGHLVDTTWALIGHELVATENPSGGFYSQETRRRLPDLNDRIQYFKEIGFHAYPRRPLSARFNP